MERGKKITYKARIQPETPDLLAAMAADCGFFVTMPGRYFGKPSAGDFLDALAAAYDRDPAAAITALGKLVEGDGSPLD